MVPLCIFIETKYIPNNAMKTHRIIEIRKFTSTFTKIVKERFLGFRITFVDNAYYVALEIFFLAQRFKVVSNSEKTKNLT